MRIPDPAAGLARLPVDLTNGQFLLMPLEMLTAAGASAAGVVVGNPRFRIRFRTLAGDFRLASRRAEIRHGAV